MTREETIKYLKLFIPSFGRKFEDEELFGPEGWICRDQKDIPDTIPENYCEGIKVLRDGNEFITMSVNEFQRVFENESLPEGRGVRFEYHNYCGNPHLYGQLLIDGVEMLYHDRKNQRVITTTPSREEAKANPLLEKISYRWDMEICRILSQEEIDREPRMWEHYDAGSRTDRFTDFRELLATAAYLTVKRIEGPVFLTLHDSYFQKKNLLLTVSSVGEVAFTELFKKHLGI